MFYSITHLSKAVCGFDVEPVHDSQNQFWDKLDHFVLVSLRGKLAQLRLQLYAKKDMMSG
jgi:hypothetical protein